MIDHTELEKFKEMLCTASPREIAGVIVALARNPKKHRRAYGSMRILSSAQMP